MKQTERLRKGKTEGRKDQAETTGPEEWPRSASIQFSFCLLHPTLDTGKVNGCRQEVPIKSLFPLDRRPGKGEPNKTEHSGITTTPFLQNTTGKNCLSRGTPPGKGQAEHLGCHSHQ